MKRPLYWLLVMMLGTLSLMNNIPAAASARNWLTEADLNDEDSIAPLDLSLVVGSWRLNEGSGTTIGDSSGQGNTGRLFGTRWIDSGINEYFDAPYNSGEALLFQGQGDYADVLDSNSLNMTDQLTLEVWAEARGTSLGTALQPALDCSQIRAYDRFAADGVYWLDPNGGDSSDKFQAYCNMTNEGGGWTMCYSEKMNMVHLSTEYTYTGSYATPGYRADCRNIPFSDIIYINHEVNENAWFRRKTAGNITIAGCGYSNGCQGGSLWEAHGVAPTSYDYQMLVCDSGWMWTGIFISGYSTSCWKACNSWCSDTSTAYFRPDGDDASSFNGVAFNQNGHTNVTYKNMSLGIRTTVGSAATYAGRSCKDILDKASSRGDGLYWIDPDGWGGKSPYQVYCDMTTDGGGWTLILRDEWDTQGVAKGQTSLPLENSVGIPTGQADYVGPWKTITGDYLYSLRSGSGDTKFISHQSVPLGNNKTNVQAGAYDQPIKTLTGGFIVMAGSVSSARLNFFETYGNGDANCGSVSTDRDNGDNCWNNFFGNYIWENMPGGNSYTTNQAGHINELYVRESNPGRFVILPGRSCQDILQRGSAIGDGLYWVDPDGPGGNAAMQVYCDMTTASGGWTIPLFLGGQDSIVDRLSYQNFCKGKGYPLVGWGVEDRDSWLALKRMLYKTNHVLKTSGWPNARANIGLPLVKMGSTTPMYSVYDGVTSALLPPNLLGDYCDQDSGQFFCGYWYSTGWSDNNLNSYPDPEDWGNTHDDAATWFNCMYREPANTFRVGGDILRKGKAYGLALQNGVLVAGINQNTLSASVGEGWNHLVMTYDKSLSSNNLKLYVNGILKTQTTVSGSPSIMTTTSNLLIGSGFRGSLDEILIYHSALTATEVLQRYNQFAGGLVGRWEFETGFGPTAYDTSGHGYNGTLQNGPKWQASTIAERFNNFEESGNALSFDGIDDAVGLVNQSVAVTGNAARTILAWIKTSRTGVYQAIVASGNPANAQAFNLVLYSGPNTGVVGVMGYNNDFYPSSGRQVNDGRWHLVGAVYDGAGTIRTYVDGQLDNSGTITFATAGQNNYIGRSNHVGNEKFFAGQIDNVEFYSRALDFYEILRKYEQYSWGLVGQWKFDEGSGTTTNDSSGFANNGTLNGPIWQTSTLGTAQKGAPTGTMMTFDGVNDDVSAGSASNLRMADMFTVEAWIYPTGSGSGSAGIGGTIVNKEGEYELVRFSDGTIRFSASDSAINWSRWENTSWVAPLNTWSHIAWTYSMYEQKFRVYANGNQIYQATGLDRIGDYHTNWDELRIGGRQGTVQNFQGSIDEVSVYRWCLYPQEIFYHANLIKKTGFPLAIIGNPANDASFVKNSAITFTASGSTDAYGQNPGIVSYFWDFEDGTPIVKRDSSVTVTYSTPGDKKVKLWVIDQDGNPSTLRLGEGLITIHITSSGSLFDRIDNIKMKH